MQQTDKKNIRKTTNLHQDQYEYVIEEGSVFRRVGENKKTQNLSSAKSPLEKLITKHQAMVSAYLQDRFNKKIRENHWSDYLLRSSFYFSFFPPIAILLGIAYLIVLQFRSKPEISEAFMVTNLVQYCFQRVSSDLLEDLSSIKVEIFFEPKKRKFQFILCHTYF